MIKFKFCFLRMFKNLCPLSWANLRKLAGGKFGRLSFLFPFLGYVILYNEPVSEVFCDLGRSSNCGALDLWKLHFLFFGMLLFSLSAILVEITCPAIQMSSPSDLVYLQQIYYFETGTSLRDQYFRLREHLGQSFERRVRDLINSANGSEISVINRSIDAKMFEACKTELICCFFYSLNNSRRSLRYVFSVFLASGIFLMLIPTFWMIYAVLSNVFGDWLGIKV